MADKDTLIDAGELTSPQPKEPPTQVQIEIGGQKFIVAPAMAEALKAEADAQAKTVKELRAETDRLRTAQPPPSPPPQQAPQKPPIADRLFSDPDTVLEEHGKAVEERVAAKLREEYNADKARAEFWRLFDKENDDLVEDHDLTLFVMQRDYNELIKLSHKEQRDAIAERARKMLGKNAKGRSNPDTVIVEGGGTAPSAPPVSPADAEDDNVTSISSILRKGREARREARHDRRKAG